MKKNFYNLMLLVALLFSAVSQVSGQTMPTLSTAGSDVWYYIQFKNSGTVFEDSQASVSYSPGTKIMKSAAFAATDAQLWKVEAKTGGGYLFTSKSGNKINYLGEAVDKTHSISKYVTDATGIALYIFPSVNPNFPASFEITRSSFLTVTGTYSIAPHAGTGVGYYLGNDFSSKDNAPLVFVPEANASELMQNTIAAATARLSASVAGLLPGQFTVASRTALQNAITTAQGAAVSTSSIAALQTALTDYTKTIILPTTSAGTDKWYFIQGDRDNGDAFMTSQGAGQPLNTTPLDYSDSQMWKVVKNTNGSAAGIALVNKATGEYLNTDLLTGRLVSQAAMPRRNLEFINTNLSTGNAYRFWIQSTVADSLVPYRLQAGYTSVVVTTAATATTPAVIVPAFSSINFNGGNPYDKSTWQLVDHVLALQAKINAARDYIQLNTEGFGKRPVSAAADLQTAIADAQLFVDGSASQEECKLACQTITDGMSTLFQAPVSKKLTDLLSSDPENYKWHHIRSYATQAGYCFGKVISEGTRAVGSKFTFEDKTATLSDKQLFRFELSTDGTKVLSIIDKKGNYLAAGGAIAPIGAVGSEFAITAWADSIAFGIVPKGQNPIHAAASGAEILNWNSQAGSASAWVFDAVLEDSKMPADAAQCRAILQARINIVKAHVIEYSNEFGKHTAEQGAKILQLIANAQAIIDRSGSRDECSASIKAVNLELIVFDASPIIKDIQTLVSTNSKYKWYWVKSNATSAGYCYGKVMSSGTRVVNEKYTFEDKTVPAADNQLFRFELNLEQTAVVGIVDKNGNYLGPEGKIQSASTEGNEFAITALDDNVSFWIKPTDKHPIHAAASGAEILNWDSGAGSASAWVFEFAMETAKPVLATPRTVTVSSSNDTQGTAFITGTTNTTITTDNMEVSVSATAIKGYIFTKWTVAGDSVSARSPYVYKGATDVTLVANFIKGIYRPMTRSYASNPFVQQAGRYLESAKATINTSPFNIFSGVTVNPNPIGETVVSNQVVGDALLDFTATKIVLPIGTTSFDLTCVGKKTAGTEEDLQWTQQIAFIDWNQDFDFTDADEATEGSVAGVDGNYPQHVDPAGFTRTITLPASLSTGTYRMRVVYNEGSNWAKSIWTSNNINNGVAYDFTVVYGWPTKVTDYSTSNVNVVVINNKMRVTNAENSTLLVTDLAGRMISSYKVNSSVQEFEAPAAKGIYFVTIQSGTDKAITVKVIR